MRTILALLPLLLAATTVIACGRPMGTPCSSNAVCGEGTCLKGVCAGYGCTDDFDCDNDHVCASVYGTFVCALPCEADDDCKGQQSCSAVPTSTDDGTDTVDYCM